MADRMLQVYARGRDRTGTGREPRGILRAPALAAHADNRPASRGVAGATGHAVTALDCSRLPSIPGGIPSDFRVLAGCGV